MDEYTKTFGDSVLDSAKREAISRMRWAISSSSLDDIPSVTSALQQVTLLRVYHQVVRIVKYLDLMDRLEEKLYDSISYELDSASTSDFSTIARLLSIQEKLQKSIIESNKLLAPFLDMAQYPAFSSIPDTSTIQKDVLSLDSGQRDALRENAGAILAELAEIESVEVRE